MINLTAKLSELIPPNCILDLETADKSEALRAMGDALAKTERVTDGEALYRALLERERQASTGVGPGFAIPHVKIPQVADYVAAVGRSRRGIEFEALDGKPVHLIFMIAASDRQTREFVRILAQVAHLLKSFEVRERLIAAADPAAILTVIRENER